MREKTIRVDYRIRLLIFHRETREEDSDEHHTLYLILSRAYLWTGRCFNLAKDYYELRLIFVSSRES